MKIESDDRIARELQHEVPKRSTAICSRHRAALVRGLVRVAAVPLRPARVSNQFVDQIVRFDAEALSA